MEQIIQRLVREVLENRRRSPRRLGEQSTARSSLETQLLQEVAQTEKKLANARLAVSRLVDKIKENESELSENFFNELHNTYTDINDAYRGQGEWVEDFD